MRGNPQPLGRVSLRLFGNGTGSSGILRGGPSSPKSLPRGARGRAESMWPSRFARSTMPNAPMKGMPRNSAQRLPARSSMIATQPLGAAATISGEGVSPAARAAARGSRPGHPGGIHSGAAVLASAREMPRRSSAAGAPTPEATSAWQRPWRTCSGSRGIPRLRTSSSICSRMTS